jgi:transposase
MMGGQKMSENRGTPITSSTQRAHRNREISRVRLGGASWRTIAQEFGVSEKTARRAFEEHLHGVAPLPVLRRG